MGRGPAWRGLCWKAGYALTTPYRMTPPSDYPLWVLAHVIVARGGGMGAKGVIVIEITRCRWVRVVIFRVIGQRQGNF